MGEPGQEVPQVARWRWTRSAGVVLRCRSHEAKISVISVEFTYNKQKAGCHNGSLLFLWGLYLFLDTGVLHGPRQHLLDEVVAGSFGLFRKGIQLLQ